MISTGSKGHEGDNKCRRKGGYEMVEMKKDNQYDLRGDTHGTKGGPFIPNRGVGG
jgi:hypothetical protein